MEIYKSIHDQSIYEISDLGNVRNKKTGKILKPCLFKKTGYYYVDLCKNGKKHRKLLHRLVLLSFSDIVKAQVNHINGIKSDNRLVNLEWCTASENQKHSIRIGLRHTKGEKNSQSKLSEIDVLSIIKDDRDYKTISTQYEISLPTVYDIKRGRSWKHIPRT